MKRKPWSQAHGFIGCCGHLSAARQVVKQPRNKREIVSAIDYGRRRLKCWIFPKRATHDFTGVNSNRGEPSMGARSRQDKWPCVRSTSKPALFSQLCGGLHRPQCPPVAGNSVIDGPHASRTRAPHHHSLSSRPLFFVPHGAEISRHRGRVTL